MRPGEIRESLLKLRALDVARMVNEEPSPPHWVVEGLVCEGMLTVLNGKEGEGKSLLAQVLSAGVAAGESEAGFSCRRGRVAIVDAENGEHEIHRRVHALGLPSEGIEVFEARSDFDLREDLDELRWVLETHRPDLLVLDSFRSLWRGKENDSAEVASALDPLRGLVRDYGTGALLLHHSGRAHGDYRGSSAIGASAELGFKLERAEADPDRGRRYLDTWKCRPAAEPPRRWLRLEVEGTRVFIGPAEAFAGGTSNGTAGSRALIREELPPRVLASLTDRPSTRASIARAVGRDPKDRSVGRVLVALEEEGKAEQVKGGWRRTSPSTRHPATEGKKCHQQEKKWGGRDGGTWPLVTPGDVDRFFERAKVVFPGSRELGGRA